MPKYQCSTPLMICRDTGELPRFLENKYSFVL